MGTQDSRTFFDSHFPGNRLVNPHVKQEVLPNFAKSGTKQQVRQSLGTHQTAKLLSIHSRPRPHPAVTAGCPCHLVLGSPPTSTMLISITQQLSPEPAQQHVCHSVVWPPPAPSVIKLQLNLQFIACIIM